MTTDQYLQSLSDAQVKLIVEALTDDDRPEAKKARWLAQLELKRRGIHG
jgi:hypothetical protein